MLISLEQEMPAIHLRDGSPVPPDVFIDLWKELAQQGWTADGGFAISRAIPSPAVKPMQMISTDTGPTIEIAPCPGESIDDVERQTTALRSFIGRELRKRGIGLLGSGISPRLGNTESEYYRFRTPRSAYDYAIRVRGWQHRTLVNIAAIQEVIDVPVSLAPLALSVMHKLAGVFIFLFRNDPELKREGARLLTVRPKAWRDQVSQTGRFGDDARKVAVPAHEVRSWEDYLRLLWDSNPMFLVGTKTSGLVYVPEHPTFMTFLSHPPKGGWETEQLDGTRGESVMPNFTHVIQSDWTYMGHARLRLFWKEGTDVREFVNAYQAGSETLDSFMAQNLAKVLIENRSSASPAPGTEMASVALATGIIENLAEVATYLARKPYSFWIKVAESAEHAPFKSHVGDVSIPELAHEIVSLAKRGLTKRDRDEEQYLEPLVERISSGVSPSECMLREFERGGEDAVVEKLLYRFS